MVLGKAIVAQALYEVVSNKFSHVCIHMWPVQVTEIIKNTPKAQKEPKKSKNNEKNNKNDINSCEKYMLRMRQEPGKPHKSLQCHKDLSGWGRPSRSLVFSVCFALLLHSCRLRVCFVLSLSVLVLELHATQ